MSGQRVEQCDLLIAGGGPVGLVLGIGAARAGLSVVVAEGSDPRQREIQTSFDGRMLALSLGSRQLMEEIGIWEALAPISTAIHHVHVSQRGHLGVTRLHAAELGVPALGYSVLGRELGEVLMALAQSQPGLQLLQPARVETFEQQAEAVTVRVSGEAGEHRIRARLLVGADGTRSTVRQRLGWPVQEKDYGSHAILAQVESWLPHEGWSFERFTPEGPVALLPWKTHHHKAVYVCPDDQLERLMALDDDAWLAAFTERMGPRFGGFRATSPRVAYPLKAVYVPRVAEGRVALLGNASHTQHPVAAQGLNLGLRDVQDYLAALRQPHALNDPAWLVDYERQRQRDHRRVMGMTDSLINLFQLPQPVTGHLRGLGLLAVEMLPGLKRRIARQGMGVGNA